MELREFFDGQMAWVRETAREIRVSLRADVLYASITIKATPLFIAPSRRRATRGSLTLECRHTSSAPKLSTLAASAASPPAA